MKYTSFQLRVQAKKTNSSSCFKMPLAEKETRRILIIFSRQKKNKTPSLLNLPFKVKTVIKVQESTSSEKK